MEKANKKQRPHIEMGKAEDKEEEEEEESSIVIGVEFSTNLKHHRLDL